MKHLGDITKIDGAEIEPVDVITGGSPCQDLSVAGKRAGLAGERSGLFMEQIRIVKEMRQHERDIGRPNQLVRPRYMVWENVPGAFSSNDGEDFQAVLEEIVKIVETSVPDLRTVVRGGWTKQGCIYSDMGSWSIAWRVHDAQFWGVPQRRKRIALVADFGGLSAPEILFERKGLSRDFEPSIEKRERTAGAAKKGIGGSSYTLKIRGGVDRDSSGRKAGKGALVQEEKSGTLGVSQDQTLFCLNGQGGADAQITEDITATLTAATNGNGNNRCAVAYNIGSYESNSWKSPNPSSGVYEAEKSKTLDDNCGNPACNQGGTAIVYGADMYNKTLTGDVTKTLNASASDSDHVPCVIEENECQMVSGPLMASGYAKNGTQEAMNGMYVVPKCHGKDCGNTPIVNEPTMIEMTSTKNTVIEDGISPTLTARMGTGGNQVNSVCMETSFYSAYEEQSPAQLSRQYKDPNIVSIGIDRAAFNMGQNAKGTPTFDDELPASLVRSGPNAVETRSVVRRLTPMECERLQGYPDGWTDIGAWTDTNGKLHKESSDSSRYKALGNSIALPFWFWLLRRIAAQYERPATLGSLFDGIGGFPLCWERCNGKGTARWASEIEEFPVAVTKYHFGEE